MDSVALNAGSAEVEELRYMTIGGLARPIIFIVFSQYCDRYL